MQTFNAEVPDAQKSDLRKFGLIMGGFIFALFGLLFPWLAERAMPDWPWITLVVFWVWALLLPTTLKPVYWVWMKLGGAVGYINTRLIMVIVFYVVFFPVGLVMKAMGKDPMRRKLKADQASYREESKAITPKAMERPF